MAITAATMTASARATARKRMKGVAALSPSSTTCSKRLISATGWWTNRLASSLISCARRSVPCRSSGDALMQRPLTVAGAVVFQDRLERRRPSPSRCVRAVRPSAGRQRGMVAGSRTRG